MAEKLTDYLKGVGVRAEYMHSDIVTLERVRILASLREDDFDVLVGINLLREGLDIPEVSLILVLDADKEGFLRSKTSLLQVAGRAARNVNGKVVLYGNKITKSMQHLIDETKRRRDVQTKHNIKNNITPKTIVKKHSDILSSLSPSISINNKPSLSQLKKNNIKIDSLDEIELLDLIEKLKRKMKKYAQDFQFEEAALLRDQIIELSKERKK